MPLFWNRRIAQADLANIHFMLRYGQIRPTVSQSQTCCAVKRLTTFRSDVSSTSSVNAGTLRPSSSAVQPDNGPFNHSGIGELKPTLRRAVRMLSGIRPAIARRATTLVAPSADLLVSGSAIV